MTRALGTLLAVLTLVALAQPVSAADDWPTGYGLHHTYGEMLIELQQLARDRPDIVALRSMGRSYEGRKLWLAKISDNVAIDESEPEAYFQAGIHANEHTGTEQAMAMIQWLVDGYGTDARTSAIVDGMEVWIAPMVNPDGAMFDISDGTFQNWRKDRKPNAGTTEIGTDINRNFGYRWGCCGHSSANPAGKYYRGSMKWSTPEARRICDFIKSRRIGGVQQIALGADLHGHGGFVTYPMAYTPDDLPPDLPPC